jgi:hypothetical protein
MSNVILFISAVVAHWLVTFGGVAMVGFGLWEKYKHKETAKWIFWGLAVVLLVVAFYQAWSDEHHNTEVVIGEKANLSGANYTLAQQNQRLLDLLGAKDRPLVVQLPPDVEVEKLLRQQQRELEQLKQARPSPRKKAVQLSRDIIAFLADKIKNQPHMEPGVDANVYINWMNGIASDYTNQFALRIASTEEDARNAGVNANNIMTCNYSNGNTFGVQDCAQKIANLAEQLPQ